MDQQTDRAKYLAWAKELAYDAGNIMLEHFTIGVHTEIKADSTPLTLADTAVNKLVVDRVTASFPEHSVLGEEQSSLQANAQYTWVCDPIDGTPMYAAGLPVNVFALALVENDSGLPVVAVIYDPYMKRLYSAIKNEGAFVNDQRIQVSKTSQLSEATVSTTSDRSEIVDPAAFKSEVAAHCHRTRAMGSVLYESMVVATGFFEAQVFIGSGAHDAAAAKLIVEEAGGKVTDLFGNEQRYDRNINGALISNGHVHDELVSIARTCKKLSGI